MSGSDFSKRYVDLANARLGSVVTYATDDFFADKARLIDPADPVFIPGKYDDNGKWMDGWESRRKRTSGYDYAIIKLGYAGTIYGVNIDTSNFTGNFPPAASLEACVSDADVPRDDTEWTELIAPMTLKGDSHHLVDVANSGVWTHLRLNIFPDGGVARLRVYGRVHKDWSRADTSQTFDLMSLTNGARPVVANNEHFGKLSNIMAPGKGINMGDGWETRRRREPGNDWSIIELAHTGIIESALVDTAFFKGNYPSAISLQAALVEKTTDESLPTQSQFWPELLIKSALQADAEQSFTKMEDIGPINHVRINIYPDGGISRLRLFGKVAYL